MSSWPVIRISCKLPMDLIKIPRCPPEHRGLAIRSGDRLKEGTKEGFILLDTDLLVAHNDA